MQHFASRFELAQVLGARGVEFGQRGFSGLEPILRGGQGLRQRLQLDLLVCQPGGIRARQLRLFLRQSALTRIQLFKLALGVAEAVFVHLTRLLRL